MEVESRLAESLIAKTEGVINLVGAVLAKSIGSNSPSKEAAATGSFVIPLSHLLQLYF